MVMPCGLGIALFYEREYVLFHKSKMLLYTDLIADPLVVSVAFVVRGRERYTDLIADSLVVSVAFVVRGRERGTKAPCTLGTIYQF